MNDDFQWKTQKTSEIEELKYRMEHCFEVIYGLGYENKAIIENYNKLRLELRALKRSLKKPCRRKK